MKYNQLKDMKRLKKLLNKKVPPATSTELAITFAIGLILPYLFFCIFVF